MEGAIKGGAVYCPMDPESKLTFSRSIRSMGIIPAFGLQYDFSCCRVIPSKGLMVSSTSLNMNNVSTSPTGLNKNYTTYYLIRSGAGIQNMPL